MSRLIDADSLALFPNNPESGTDDMINSWIEECGLSNLELYITEDCPVDVEHALKELCWRVISGYINVIETEPTAYDVDKVVNELKLLQGNARLERKTIADEEVEELCDCDDWYDSGYTTGYLNAQINTYQKALDIVKAGVKDE